MPRYFFDLCNGNGWMTDEEGALYADPKAMEGEALISARSIIAGDILEGASINLGHFLAVRDDTGEEIYRLHFRDAVTVQDFPPAF